MLCSRPRPLNAIAPVPGLPNAQRERPSRVAGSFSGHKRQVGYSTKVARSASIEATLDSFSA